MVRPEEERAVVWEGGREFNDLGFSVAKVHHGRFRRREIRPPDTEAGRTHEAPDPESHETRRAGL